jgi:hypothetical protein
MSFQLSWLLGLSFGLLAALLAFVISFEAYRRQQFASARIWRESLTAAAFAFAVFLVASITLGYLLKKII